MAFDLGLLVHLILFRSSSKVKAIGQRSRSQEECVPFWLQMHLMRSRTHSESPDCSTKRAHSWSVVDSLC